MILPRVFARPVFEIGRISYRLQYKRCSCRNATGERCTAVVSRRSRSSLCFACRLDCEQPTNATSLVVSRSVLYWALGLAALNVTLAVVIIRAVL